MRTPVISFSPPRSFPKEMGTFLIPAPRLMTEDQINCPYGFDPAQHVFAIKVCKSNEARATSFSKPRAEQTTTLSCGNKNLKEVVVKMIPDYDPKKRYKVTGEFDAENRVMYFDMTTAEVSLFRATDK